MPAAASCAGLLAVIGLAAAGCGGPEGARPSYIGAGAYASMANSGAQADPLAARDLISIFRHNYGAVPLTIDPVLQASALQKARAMAAADKASGGVVVTGRAVVVSNVSAGYQSVADAFSGWRGAPQQKANMLNAQVRRMGIAAVFAPGSKYRVFWALVLTE